MFASTWRSFAASSRLIRPVATDLLTEPSMGYRFRP